MFVTDRISHRRFLVDTGAQVSVIPADAHDRHKGPSGTPLQAANGSTILAYGARTVPLVFKSKEYHVRLIVTDVKQPLLGADFLRNNNLLVDLRRRCLIDEADTYSSTPCSAAKSSGQQLAMIDTASNLFQHVNNPLWPSRIAIRQKRDVFRTYPIYRESCRAHSPIQFVTLLDLPQAPVSSTRNFFVDSTINRLTIRADGAEPLRIYVFDQSGQAPMIVTRPKRSIGHPIFSSYFNKQTSHVRFKQTDKGIGLFHSKNETKRQQQIQQLKQQQQQQILQLKQRQIPSNKTSNMTHIHQQSIITYNHHLSSSVLDVDYKSNSLPPSYIGRHRQKRQIFGYEEDNNMKTRHWDFSPTPGKWHISVGHAGIKVKVIAKSAIKFMLHFYGLQSNLRITMPVRANEVVRVGVDMEGLECVYEESLALQLFNLEHIVLQNRTLFYTKFNVIFKIPSEPFIPVVVGKDLNNYDFQRWGSTVIIPEQFIVTSVDGEINAHLIPGAECRIGVDIDNIACMTGHFSLMGVTGNAENFLVVNRSTKELVIPPHETRHAVVGLYISSVISSRLETDLRITVACLDRTNQKKTVIVPLSAYPQSYQEDRTPPYYKLQESIGGCSLNIPCQYQNWTTHVMIFDKLTGVQNVTIETRMKNNSRVEHVYNKLEWNNEGDDISTNSDAYVIRKVSSTMDKKNNSTGRINFFRSGWQRMADVSYSSDCCHPTFYLNVSDYANNRATYPIKAPILNIHSTVTYTLLTGSTTASSTAFQTTHSKKPVTFTSNMSTMSTTHSTDQLSPLSLSTLSLSTLSSTFITTIATGSRAVKEKSSWWLGGQLTPTRIAALVLGIIGGLCGVALCGLCIFHKYRKRLVGWRMRMRIKRARKAERKESDITMGSSWESGSRRDDNSIMGSTSSYPLDGSVRSDVSSSSGISFEGARRLARFNRHNRGSDTNKNHISVIFHGDQAESFYRGTGHDADINDECETHFTRLADSQERRLSESDGRSTISSYNASDRIKQSGDTYVSMMDVQKKLEEMELLHQGLRDRAGATGNIDENECNCCRVGLTEVGEIQRGQDPLSDDSGYVTNGSGNTSSSAGSLERKSPSRSEQGLAKGDLHRFRGCEGCSNTFPLVLSDHMRQTVSNSNDAIHYDKYQDLDNKSDDKTYHGNTIDCHGSDQELSSQSRRQRSKSYSIVLFNRTRSMRSMSSHHVEIYRKKPNAQAQNGSETPTGRFFNKATLVQTSSTGEVRRVPVLVHSFPKRVRHVEEDNLSPTTLNKVNNSSSDPGNLASVSMTSKDTKDCKRLS